MAPRILLVDDEPDILIILERFLTRLGHEVTSVKSGEAALMLLEQRTFDLVVIDKNLPGLDGVTLASLARPFNERMGIILMTAYASLSSAQELTGVTDAYLTKPFSLQSFQRVLDNVLERRRAPAPVIAEAPAPGQPSSVLLVEPDPATSARLSRLLRALGLRVEIGAGVEDLTRNPELDALVIDAGRLSTQDHPAIWRRQGKSPGFRVVVLSKARTVDDSVKAIAVAASAHLLSTGTDANLSSELCMGLGLMRPVTAPAAAMG